MTVRQIAETVGKKERAVHNWVTKLSAKNADISAKIAQARATSKPADYTLDETVLIIETGMGKNAAGIFRANVERSQDDDRPLTRRDIPEIVRETVRETISQLLPVIKSIFQPEMATVTSGYFQIPETVEINPRDELRELINHYVTRTGLDYSQAWGNLYNKFYYMDHLNITLLAKNRGVRPIDVIEERRLMGKAIQYAKAMIGME